MSTGEALDYYQHRYSVTDGIEPEEYGTADAFIGIKFENNTGLIVHVFSPSGTEIQVPPSASSVRVPLRDNSPDKAFTMKYQVRQGTDIRQGDILVQQPSNVIHAHPYKTVRLTIPYMELLNGPFLCHDFTLVFALPQFVNAAKRLCVFSEEFGNVAINKLADEYFGNRVEFHRENCRRFDTGEEDLNIEPVAPFLMFANLYDTKVKRLYTEVNGNVVPITVRHDTWRAEGLVLARSEMGRDHAITKLYELPASEIQHLRDGKMVEIVADHFVWKVCSKEKVLWDDLLEASVESREMIHASELKLRIEEACQQLKEQIERLQKEKELLESEKKEVATELAITKMKLRRYENADNDLTDLSENQFKLQQARMKVSSDQWKYVAEQAKYQHDNETREFDRRMRELEMQVKEQEASVARWKAAAAITGSVAAIGGLIAGFLMSKKS